MHRQPLNHYFLRFFKIPSMIGRVIWLFGAVAASLALMGLFGLALYASRRRAREMALRKVMGARPWQIQLLLVRQYIAPVLVACLVALPAAYVSLDIYLRFFPERVTYVGAVVCAAGLVALLSAWAVLALQALSLARQSPAVSLSAAQ